MGVVTIENTCLHPHWNGPCFSDAKSVAVPPRMKFLFALSEHFEAVSSVLPANCLHPLRETAMRFTVACCNNHSEKQLFVVLTEN
jgi:hypothetical protein